MMTRLIRLHVVAACAIGCLISMESPRAKADTAATDAGGTTLKEVIVTVNRRKQNLQDVGTSVTAFSGQDLKSFASNDVTELSNHVPALQYNQYSPTVTIFNIRGVSQNDYADHLEAPVAVYVDDEYVSATGALSGAMFDLAGVEVDRGPQGTLFGRNATGGVVKLTTAEPTETPEGYMTVTGGSFDEADTEGALSGPIGGDWLGRIAFSTNYNHGYLENRIGPNLGNANNYALRTELKRAIGTAGSLLLTVHGSRDIGEHEGAYSWAGAYPCAHDLGCYLPPTLNYWNTCPGCDIGGYYNSSPFSGEYNSPTFFFRTIGGATAKLTWEFPFATFTSVTDYWMMHKQYAEDSDASPNFIYAYHTQQKFLQWSEENRLAGATDRLNWTAGIYLLGIQSSDNVVSEAPPYTSVTPYSNQTFSAAGYGQVEYKESSQWSTIAGARYTQDRKEETYQLYFDGVQTVVFNPTADGPLARRTYPMVTAKLEQDYRPVKNVMLYVSYNRGAKGGDFSAPNFPPVDINSLEYGSETLTDYETGFKATMFHGAVRLNGDAFYYNYHNYQAFSFYDLVAHITNRNAIDKGMEFELAAMPVSGLTVQAGLSLLDTEVEGLTLPDGTLASRYLPQAPANSFTLSATYAHPLAGGVMSLETDWKHDSSEYFTVLNNPDEWEPGEIHGDVRLSYDFPKHWQVAFTVENVTNKLYSIYREDFSAIGSTQNVWAKPRWFKLSVTYNLH